jgi:NAD(P)-dependent dehydrogenase (short-subunit alcohol dehydrogenase family)
VVVVASDAHGFGDVDPGDWQSERDWKPMRAYGRSKLCNILFTAELSRRVAGTGVAVNCLHPGFIGTSLGRDHWLAPVALPVLRLFVKGPERGARTSVALATTDLGVHNGGRYFVDGKAKSVKPYADDAVKAARLWEDSARMVGLEH